FAARMQSLAAVLVTLVTAAAAAPFGDAALNPAEAAAATAALAALSTNQTGHAMIGGQTASAGAWPWTVSLCIQNWFGGCGYYAAGAIISSKWIVTTYSGVYDPVMETSWRVCAGSLDWSCKGNHAQKHTVYKIWHKTDANLDTHYHDISLIQISDSFTFNDYVKPISVLTNDDDMVKPGNYAWFTSWGHISNSATASVTDNLHQANMLVGVSGCSTFSDHSTFCGGGSGPTTCNYDMGGPMMRQKNGVYYLIGLSATKDYTVFNSCSSPTIFTRVSAFCDFMIGTAGVHCV
ncbi:hypothetical protein PENTCL1PPCAC_3825, partial [Pristionchus entomophagus]